MTDTSYRMVVTDQGNPDAEHAIEAGLGEYNHQMAGYTDARTLSVHVIDPDSGQVVGGLSGRTSFGLLFIDLFFLPKALRGNQLGRKIIEAAEAEAKQRGCSSAVLFTITFQAPEFYERRGYRVLGRVECPPPGHTRICMIKTL